MRLDKALLVRGMVKSRTLAARLIQAGAVQVNEQLALKPSQQVDPDDRLTLLESGVNSYVTRAGHKLAAALKAFGIQVSGRRCLDAGASTGGFTDVLLQQGAAQVLAVDVGHGQFDSRLAKDGRVQLFEGVNVRYLQQQELAGPVDLTVADLSFISLTLVLPALTGVTRAGGELVLLVKPQFEVGKDGLGPGAIVKDPRARQAALHTVEGAARELGLDIAGQQESVLPGQNGNIEYFLWCRKP